MKPPSFYRHQQKSVIFVALLLFQLVLILLQLWLFVAVLENVIGGHFQMAVPAAIGSVLIFGINYWMLRGVKNIERAP